MPKLWEELEESEYIMEDITNNLWMKFWYSFLYEKNTY